MAGFYPRMATKILRPAGKERVRTRRTGGPALRSLAMTMGAGMVPSIGLVDEPEQTGFVGTLKRHLIMGVQSAGFKV